MGRYNRERVESEMSWNSVAQKLEAIYDITLSRWRRPPRRDLAPLAGRTESRSGQLRARTEGFANEVTIEAFVTCEEEPRDTRNE